MDGEYMYIVRIQTVLTTREIDSVVQLLLLLLMSLIWNIYIHIVYIQMDHTLLTGGGKTGLRESRAR